MQPASVGGILGSYPHLNDATTAPSRGGGILGQLDRWNDAWSSNSTASPYLSPSFGTGGGVPPSLELPKTNPSQSAPDWSKPAAPSVPTIGSLSAASSPTLPSWMQFPQARDSAGDATRSNGEGVVAPPLQHLDSAKYWGAQSPPSDASNAGAPAFYLSPV